MLVGVSAQWLTEYRQEAPVATQLHNILFKLSSSDAQWPQQRSDTRTPERSAGCAGIGSAGLPELLAKSV